MAPPLSEPVARIPSPVAPWTVKSSIFTWLDLIVTAARHGALPGPLGPSWSHMPLAVVEPLITASLPTSVNGVETITSSV